MYIIGYDKVNICLQSYLDVVLIHSLMKEVCNFCKILCTKVFKPFEIFLPFYLLCVRVCMCVGKSLPIDLFRNISGLCHWILYQVPLIPEALNLPLVQTRPINSILLSLHIPFVLMKYVTELCSMCSNLLKKGQSAYNSQLFTNGSVGQCWQSNPK